MVVIVYTGTGPGKTCAALGIALRALGHRKRVVVVQFMKWWKDTGEYKIAKRLGKSLVIRQFGRKGWIGLRNLTAEDRKLAQRALAFAKQTLAEKPDLLILDEINLAARIGLLDKKEVLEFLDTIPKEVTVYLTGRYAPKEFIKRADYVSEIKAVKHPPIDKEKGKIGIDY